MTAVPLEPLEEELELVEEPLDAEPEDTRLLDAELDDTAPLELVAPLEVAEPLELLVTLPEEEVVTGLPLDDDATLLPPPPVESGNMPPPPVVAAPEQATARGTQNTGRRRTEASLKE